jgi:hypothetical protein
MENKIDYIKAHLKGTIFSFIQIAGHIMFLITGESKGTGICASIFFKTDVKKDVLLSAIIIYIFYGVFILFIFLPGPCVLTSFDRFRVPVMPFILFLASYGLFGGKCEKSSGGNACV